MTFPMFTEKNVSECSLEPRILILIVSSLISKDFPHL